MVPFPQNAYNRPRRNAFTTGEIYEATQDERTQARTNLQQSAEAPTRNQHAWNTVEGRNPPLTHALPGTNSSMEARFRRASSI